MAGEDIHLDTGEYDPKSYWDARARHSNRNPFQAVCAYGLSDASNAAMEYIQRHMLNRALSDIDLNGRQVLEFGCGVGRWTRFVKERGAVYVGADISEDMLVNARSRHPETDFVNLQGPVLPFADEEFDLVFSVTVLHHNPQDAQRNIISELCRVLKPGGHLILMEAICAEYNQRPFFNMFPRPATGWVELVKKAATVDVKRISLARWWISADVFRRLPLFGRYLRRLDRADLPAHIAARAVKWSLRLAAIDKWIMPLLPKKYATNATIVFRKHQQA